MRLRWIGLVASVAIMVGPAAALGHPGRVTTDAEHIAEDTARHDTAAESQLMRTTRTATVADVRAAAAAVAGNEHEVGRWGPLVDWPVVGVHVALLPNGKVLAYDSVGDAATESFPVHNFTRATVWDPETGTHTGVNVTGYNVFCSGLAHLMDGNLFLAGGNRSAALDGIVQTHVFNYLTNTWSLGPNMAAGRWYPTVTPLRNGEMLITEGGPDVPEVRTTEGTLRRLTTASLNLPLYPWIHAAPDGRAFYAGPNQTMRALNTEGTGSWQTFAQRDGINRDYGSHALYDIGRILVAGGGASSADARTININGATPQVTANTPMASGRRQHNLTVLADGSVLATGGNSSGAGLVDLNNGVYAAELWTPTAGSPATGTWKTLAPETATRQYHSTALLLPDGRVLSSGGGICGTCDQVGYLAKNAQVFTPPYLFKADGSGDLAPRPAIASTPGTVAYGAGFQIGTPDAAAIRKVGLVRLGAVTHSVNMEQRYIPLTFSAGAGALTATAPANANIAPPGVYMLFVTDANGVPSVAKMVTVSATAPDTSPPTAPAGLTATAAGSSQVNLSWTASADDVGVTGYRVERCAGAGCTNFTEVASPTSTTYNDTGRSASTTYRYRVRAADAATNLGGYSPAAEATTSGAQPATPTFVQTAAAESNSGTSTSVPFTSNNSTGNLIVAYVIWNNSGGVSLSDSRGNAYAAAGARASWGSSWSSQVFYAKNVAGGANTVTATFANALNGGWGVVYAHEYSGVDKADPFDAQAAATGTSSGMNSGNVTTTRANDLLFNGGASSVTVTGGGTGYTTRSTSFGNRTQDRIAGTPGVYDATMTQNSSAWVSHLVAFKADTGSSDGTLPNVAISSPANGAAVSGIVNVTADATDDVGVSNVQFQVDGIDTGPVDTTAPYALAWDTRSVPNGAHTLRARATDTAGNSRLSAAVDVNVSNASTFQNEILLQGGLELPTAMKFLPDGRLLVSELQGTIRVLSPPYTSVSPNPFLQITNIGVAGVQQGIYDFVLDPNFSVNRFFYVFYTLGSPNHDRVSRFTANALLSGTVPGSELVLYEDSHDADPEHHGGALNFGNDGKLYFTTGEHFVASAAQDLRDPRGKLHRINPDGTVPTDNPFYDGSGPNYDSVWALGLRNPYRAYYDAPTDRLIIGDVGGNDASTAIEEVEVGARGANYGWPNVEGPCSAPCTSPVYSYAHNGRDAAITGGFVYHGDQFPSGYKGSYFFADYTQNWIKRLTFGADGRVNGVFNFEPADGRNDGPYGDIVYLVEGPEGSLYYLDLGYSDISGTFGVSKLRRIRFVSGNQPPIAAADASPRSGPAPLTASFSSAGSSDPEGQALSYSWTFGDGQTSTAANPSHTYQQQGTYTARLSVSDGTNTTLSTPITITVGSPPTGTILTPADGATFKAGDVISFSGDGTDPDDGALPASAFTWNIDFLHDGHVHPGQVVQGRTGTFAIPTSGHDFSGNTRYRITLTVTDSAGLKDTKSVVVVPQKVNLRLETVPTGGTVYLDGIAKTTPAVYDTLVGFQHTIEARDQAIGANDYTFGSWSDGGARLHTITVPATDQSYTATLNRVTATAPPAFVQTAAAEANSGTATSVPFAGNNTAGNLIVAYVIWNNTGTVSLSDTRGNTYASAGARTPWGGGWSSQVFYAKNVAGGANTVTATFANALNGGWGVVYAHEYAGVDKTDPLDVQTAATGSSALMNSGAVTTTRANDLLFNAGASGVTVTGGGTGYTTRSTSFGNRTQDRIAESAGAYDATMTQNSSAWVSHLVAFKAAAGTPVDQPPIAAAAASPRSGPAPLPVSFSSAGSSDPEGQALSYNWTFGDGQTSTAANPSHTYQQQGTYTARLSVSDGTNTTSSAPISINVGSPPTGTILTPADGATFKAGDVISFSGDGTDPDDGALPASAFSWSVDFLRDASVEPITAAQGKTGTFTVPTSGQDFSGNTRYRITLTVTDSAGLKDTKSVVIVPQKVNLRLETSPSGGTILLDGVAKATPAVYDTLVGRQHTLEARDQAIGGSNYTFDTWSDGGARLHTITAPATDTTYTATLKAVVSTAPPAFVQTRAGEANAGTSTSVAFTNDNTAGNLIVAYVIWDNTGTVSLSDTRGNTYASAGARRAWGTNGRWSSQVFYAKNVAGGANTVNASFETALNGGWGTLYLHEYSGVDRVNAFDVESAAIGTARAMSSGPVTTSSASLLFSAGASSHAVTAAGPDFTTRSTAFSNRTMDRISFGAGTYTATMTQDHNRWVQHVVAFRSAATLGPAN